jgi:hypothetical protein
MRHDGQKRCALSIVFLQLFIGTGQLLGAFLDASFQMLSQFR